jgi:rRNA-processing protein FCF1
MNYLSVFVDTNVFMHGFEIGIKLEDDLKALINKGFNILIHPSVEAEIIELLLDKGKIGQQANVAMNMLSHFNPYEDTRNYVGTDIAILRSAKREKGIVVTLDKILRDRCIKQNVNVISSFKKGRLKLFGYID